MARLRLFGPVREAAGVAVDEVPGATVEEVLDAAGARYGSAFATVAARCVVWVNGEVAAGASPVSATDEVALLPPISGG
jgi:molybdopterin synthase sulfur carrier subunit